MKRRVLHVGISHRRSSERAMTAEIGVPAEFSPDEARQLTAKFARVFAKVWEVEPRELAADFDMADESRDLVALEDVNVT